MAIELGDHFGARIIYLAETAGGPVRWANTYEFASVDEGGPDAVGVQAILDGLVLYAQGLLRANFLVERIDLSSIAEDGKPYDTTTFLSRTVMVRGAVLASETLLPLFNCLLVKKSVEEGREGSLLLRGLLTEEDIVSDPLTGAVSLVSRETLDNLVVLAYNDLYDACAGIAIPSLVTAVGGVVSNSRAITRLFVKGVTAKKLNNKYFDRKSSFLGGQAQQLFDQYGASALTELIGILTAGGIPLPPLLP